MKPRIPRCALVCLVLAACRPSAEIADPTPEQPAAPAPEPSGPRFVDLFVDVDYGCALDRNGLVWCFGEGPAAHLGLREASEPWTEARELPTLGPARAIAGGFDTTCALLDDGQVSCWRALGKDHRDNYGPELVPGLTDAVDLEFDSGSLCVRTETDDVWCSTIEGLDRRQVASGIVDFAINPRRACGLDDDGQLWCWGRFARWLATKKDDPELDIQVGPNGEVLMAILPGAVEVEVGASRGDIVVRRDDGTVWIEPTTGPEDVPVRAYRAVPGLDGARALDFGEGHGCVVTAEARVRCFGGNGWAQLGAGDSGYHAEPVELPGLDGIDRVDASRSLSCAMRSGVGDETPRLWCWGTRGQTLAEADEIEHHQVHDAVRSFSVDRSHACLTTTTGQNLCWGRRRLEDLDVDVRGILALPELVEPPVELDALRLVRGACFLDDSGEYRCGHMTDPRVPEIHQDTISAEFEPFSEVSGVTAYAHPQIPCLVVDDAIRCEYPEGGPRAPTPALDQIDAIAGGGRYACAIHGSDDEVSCFAIELADEPEVQADADADPDAEPPPRPPLEPLDPRARIDLPDSADTQVLVGIWTLDCFTRIDAAGVSQSFCLHAVDGIDQLDGSRIWTELPPADDVAPFAGGMCVLGRDRQVSCLSPKRDEVEVLPYTEVVALDGRGGPMCLLQQGGTLTCMGHNSWGEIGRLPEHILLLEPREISFVAPP